jgi:hypothetical protein
LNEDLLTAGEMILHVGEPTLVTTGAAPAPAPTPTRASVAFVVLELRLILLDQIRRVEERTLFHADIDKRGLHSGQNSFNPPEIDVAYDSL